MKILTETDWRNIIYRGIESDELDYKAAQDWSLLPKAGKAKFVRHCLAMANTKGGYVVVGVGEDEFGRPVHYTGLTEEQSRSFDPTDVGTFINRFVDPPIDFTLERPIVDGKKYAVFVIRRFTNLPHVCTAGCGEDELRSGVFYIRTADASSRPAYRSSEMHALIQRAMRNQREELGRVIRGVLYENQATADEQTRSHFQEAIAHSRNFFSKHCQQKGLQIEFGAMPSKYQENRFSLSELQQVTTSAYTWNPDSTFMMPNEIKDAYSTNVSLRCLDEAHGRMWQLFQSGLFYRKTVIPSAFSPENMVHWCLDAVCFTTGIFNELFPADELVQIYLTISPTENLELAGTGFICRIPEIIVHKERSVVDLSSDPGTHAADIIRSVCERFNVPAGHLTELNGAIRKILEKRS